MISNVLVLLDRATESTCAPELLHLTPGIHCEAAGDVETVLQRLGAARWDLLLCAVPLKDAGFARLVAALAQHQQRPQLVLASADDPGLLTAAMRFARACGVAVPGYVRGPLDAATMSALLRLAGTEPAPGGAARPVPDLSSGQVAGALARDEIGVAFLPQACATDPQDIEAVEVVPCWRHPQLGELSGQRLLRRLADGEGALRLVSHLLRHGAAALAMWQDHGFHPSLSCPLPLPLLALDDCAGRVARAMQEHGLHARDLTFELDLCGGGHDMRALAPALLALRLQELEFAVSCGGEGGEGGHGGIGFGTLLDVPVSELKLAPDLIDGVAIDLHVRQLVAGVVGLAKRLDMRVVATGVAQRRDFGVLHELGCDFIQGPVVGGLQPAPALVRHGMPRTADALHA